MKDKKDLLFPYSKHTLTVLIYSNKSMNFKITLIQLSEHA